MGSLSKNFHKAKYMLLISTASPSMIQLISTMKSEMESGV
jgi:hypothetical protein